MPSVFIVSAITIYREGIASFLAGRDDLTVVGTSARLVEIDVASQPHGFCDLCLVDGVGLTPTCLEQFFAAMTGIGVPVMMMGLDQGETEIVTYLNAGASAYVTKQASLEDLYLTIVETLEHGAFVQAEDVPLLLDQLRCRQDRSDRGVAASPAASESLTTRQRQVAELLSRHLSNKEIARQLGISVHTTKHHVRETMAKLGVERRSQVALCLVGANLNPVG